MLTLLLAASLGTPPVCATTAGYGQGAFVATPYVQQAHAAGYGNAYYNAAVVTAFIPVARVDPYHVEIVGDQARAQAYSAQRLQADTNLIGAINGFAKTLDTFRVQVAAATGVQAQAQAARQATQAPAQAPPAAAPPDPTPPAPGPAGEPPAAFRATQPGSLSPVQVAATSALSRRCGNCHTGDSSSGGLKIFESKDRLASYDADFLRRIGQVAYRGFVLRPDGGKLKMPPSGKIFSRDEFDPIAQMVDIAEQESTLASAGAAR